ncbi:MAG: hypothetical protein NTX08_02150 [Sphingobacteriales bacterium]|nr:hypothetical protein [Sphingobacteriales bacterium]
MPGSGNAFQFQINNLIEKLKTEKDPVEKAKIEAAIKDLKELQKSTS